MIRRLRLQRLAARIAITAMLLGALMPVIGQTLLRASDGPRWVELCTSAGMIWVLDTGAAGEGGAPDNVGGAGHCPFCLPFAGHAMLLPPVPPPAPAVALHAGGASLPAVALGATRPSWLVAFSRGPPPHT